MKYLYRPISLSAFPGCLWDYKKDCMNFIGIVEMARDIFNPCAVAEPQAAGESYFLSMYGNLDAIRRTSFVLRLLWEKRRARAPPGACFAQTTKFLATPALFTCARSACLAEDFSP